MYRILGVVAVVAWFAVSFGSRRWSLASLTRLTNCAFSTQPRGSRELLSSHLPYFRSSIFNIRSSDCRLIWRGDNGLKRSQVRQKWISHCLSSQFQGTFTFEYLAPEFPP